MQFGAFFARRVAFFRGMWYTFYMEIIKDAAMLLSFVNMKLRNLQCSLGELCDDLGWEQEEVVRRLAEAGYVYDEAHGCFR